MAMRTDDRSFIHAFALHRGGARCGVVVVRVVVVVRCGAVYASDLIKRYKREYIAGD